RAYHAVVRLATSPSAAVSLLQRKLPPIREADAGRVAALLTELDSPHFAARDRASRALVELGDPAVPGLRQALARLGPSLELRRRVEKVLDQIAAPSAEHLWQARAVEVLERAGTAEARELLQTLSRGVPGVPLTRAAQTALARLAAAP